MEHTLETTHATVTPTTNSLPAQGISTHHEPAMNPIPAYSKYGSPTEYTMHNNANKNREYFSIFRSRFGYCLDWRTIQPQPNGNVFLPYYSFWESLLFTRATRQKHRESGTETVAVFM